MPLRKVAILPVLAILAIPADAAQRDFPYKAYITGDEVYVRSGPGQNYYPTDKLNTGDAVEVYRHDPGGWYAIRPPKDSFSWVSPKHLDIGKDGLATVTGDRVAARVGSRFSDIRDVIQVRLERGEVVEVLQSGRTANGDQAAPWCKIAPPAGEFRWVYGKHVDPDFPVDGTRKTGGARSPLVQQAAGADPDPETAETAAPRRGARIESSDDDHSAIESAKHAAPPARSRPKASKRADPAPAGAESADEGDDASAAATRRLSPEEFKEELDDLELKLSMMVVEEPTVWKFDGLSRRADSLLEQAQTAVERGRARVLASRIARFADIKRHYDEVAVGRRQTDLSAAPPVAAAPATPPAVPPASEAAGRFDGVGRLTRVVSPKVGAPSYALMTEQGDVSCYVTPAPGMNLRAYEGKRIGVSGVSGLMLDPRAKHVAVKNVALLEDRRLR